ncbi:hypothetical protein GCM10010207_82340 [Streptomyces atratus]|nr:hypothetical protein GCM10010207_82340 [Streptomyces atratus]
MKVFAHGELFELVDAVLCAPGAMHTAVELTLLTRPGPEHMIRRRPPQRPANAQASGPVRSAFRHRRARTAQRKGPSGVKAWAAKRLPIRRYAAAVG